MKKKAITHDNYGCRNSGMPLGGIGAGSLELRPDGYFYNWYLMNNAGWGTGPATDVMEREGLRFALCVNGKTIKRTMALGTHYGLDPVPDGWFWFSDPYHIPWVEHPVDIKYQAAVPLAELSYHFEKNPLDIELKAWSPLVPHDVEASNTPGCILQFNLTNRSAEPLDISLLGLLKNGAGYDFPGNESLMQYDEQRRAICLSRAGLPAEHSSDGQLMLAVEAQHDDEVTYALHPRHGRDLWDPLIATGRLENTDYGNERGYIGEVGAEKKLGVPVGFRRAALCRHARLAPGASVELVFTLTWHFPNMWEAEGRQKPPARIGHYYARRFSDAAQVCDWLRKERSRLQQISADFQQAFFASSLPKWMLQAVNAQFSPLLRSAWLTYDGRFGIWEGLGRCGLQTVDVSHYASHIMMLLFPKLDVAQQRLAAANCNAQGKIPHTMHGHFSDGEGNCDKRIDLCAQFTLAVWRHARWTGNIELVRECMPVIRRNLEIMQETDRNADGLPDAVGRDQTYDKFDVTGSSILINFGYIPALLAAAEMSEWLGEDTAAKKYRAQAQKSIKTVDTQLWNGNYYDLAADPAEGARNRGCLTDQLNGDWFFQQTAGISCAKPVRLRKALKSILKNNTRMSGPESWLVNCSWPAGDIIPFERNGSDQANSPWSGVEYSFAAQLIMNGMRRQGRRVMEAVWKRHERAGMRFDHYECGEFYHRAMSAFAVYLAEFGIVFEHRTKCLTIDPPQSPCRFLLPLPTGWATAEYDKDSRSLSLSNIHGQLDIARAMLGNGTELTLMRD